MKSIKESKWLYILISILIVRVLLAILVLLIVLIILVLILVLVLVLILILVLVLILILVLLVLLVLLILKFLLSVDVILLCIQIGRIYHQRLCECIDCSLIILQSQRHISDVVPVISCRSRHRRAFANFVQ